MKFLLLLLITAQAYAGTVFIAGRGSKEQLPIVLEGLADILRDKEIAVKAPEGQRDQIIEKLGDDDILLFAELDISIWNNQDSVKLQAFNKAGKKIWEEKINKNLNWSGSKDGVAKAFVKKAKEKLEEKNFFRLVKP